VSADAAVACQVPTTSALSTVKGLRAGCSRKLPELAVSSMNSAKSSMRVWFSDATTASRSSA